MYANLVLDGNFQEFGNRDVDEMIDERKWEPPRNLTVVVDPVLVRSRGTPTQTTRDALLGKAGLHPCVEKAETSASATQSTPSASVTQGPPSFEDPLEPATNLAFGSGLVTDEAPEVNGLSNEEAREPCID
jgi:hypothetical protein